MADRLRGSFRGQTRRPRRETSWALGPRVGMGSGGTNSQSASGSAILGAGAVLSIEGATLVRLRGNIQIYLTTSAALQNGFEGSVALGVFTSEAFAIGVTAVPLPLTDVEWDGWIWNQQFRVEGPVSTGIGAFQTYPVDTKAMRKLRVGDTVALVAEPEAL